MESVEQAADLATSTEPVIQAQPQVRPDGQPLRRAKFYETTRGARHVQTPKPIKFHPYEMAAGNVMACYVTEDPAEIAELDKLVAGKKHDVFEITEKQFINCMKKKSVGSNPLGSTLFDTPIQRHAPGVPLNTEPPAAPAPGGPVQTVADALTVGAA